MCCSLYDAVEDRPVPVAPSTALAGTLVSSLHRLKDVDNNGRPLELGPLFFADLASQTVVSLSLVICPSRSRGTSV